MINTTNTNTATNDDDNINPMQQSQQRIEQEEPQKIIIKSNSINTSNKRRRPQPKPKIQQVVTEKIQGQGGAQTGNSMQTISSQQKCYTLQLKERLEKKKGLGNSSKANPQTSENKLSQSSQGKKNATSFRDPSTGKFSKIPIGKDKPLNSDNLILQHKKVIPKAIITSQKNTSMSDDIISLLDSNNENHQTDILHQQIGEQSKSQRLTYTNKILTNYVSEDKNQQNALFDKARYSKFDIKHQVIPNKLKNNDISQLQEEEVQTQTQDQNNIMFYPGSPNYMPDSQINIPNIIQNESD